MNIRDQLIRDEGKVNHAYQDSLGYWTIGVGRLIDEKKGGGLNDDEVYYLLENDIARHRNACVANISFFKNLDDARQGVLINMCFNMGINNLLHFPRMLGALERGDWQAAADELLSSAYAKQVGDRAKRLAQQVITGEWQ